MQITCEQVLERRARELMNLVPGTWLQLMLIETKTRGVMAHVKQILDSAQELSYPTLLVL